MEANTFSVNSMVKKDLWAAKDLIAYWGYTPEQISEKIKIKPVSFTIKGGDRVGTIYNYVYFANGQKLYWVFKAANGKKYFVKHNESAFDVSNLKKQGVKTIEQAQQDIKDADKGFGEKLMEKGQKVLIFLGIGAAAVYLIKAKITNK